MLRDFIYSSEQRLIAEAIGHFDVDTQKGFTVLQFVMVTPDSFLWKLLINDGIYFLYAEDYVPSLDHVKESVLKHAIKTPGVDFVRTKMSNDSNELATYSFDSEYDHVFLLKSDEDATEAYFAE